MTSALAGVKAITAGQDDKALLQQRTYPESNPGRGVTLVAVCVVALLLGGLAGAASARQGGTSMGHKADWRSAGQRAQEDSGIEYERSPAFIEEPLLLNDPYQMDSSVLFKEEDFHIDAPHWGQKLIFEQLEFGLGRQASHRALGGKNSRPYLNGAFSPAAALPVPVAGYGAYGVVKPGDNIAIRASVHASDAVMDRWGTAYIDSGAYYSALGIDYEPGWALAASQYSLTFWQRKTGEEGLGRRGFSVGYERQFDGMLSWSPFLRYSYQEADTLEVNKLATAGLNIDWLPGFDNSSLGFAYAHERTNLVERTAETFEMYFRVHLMPYLELMPDIQLVYNPVNFPAFDRITISRVNLRLVY